MTYRATHKTLKRGPLGEVPEGSQRARSEAGEPGNWHAPSKNYLSNFHQAVQPRSHQARNVPQADAEQPGHSAVSRFAVFRKGIPATWGSILFR